jgi:hypothetical protein
MKKGLFTLTLASVLSFAAGAVISAGAQTLDNGAALVAAKKHKARRHAPRESGYIACTFLGCLRIPPGCRPVTDYDWDGMPTGFDAVVCPNGKFYSRS